MKKYLVGIKKWIVKKEFHSAFAKTVIVFMYNFALLLIGKYGERRRSALEIIEDNGRINDGRRTVRALIKDMFFCRFMYGISLKEYFVFEFESLSHEGRKTFLTRSNKYEFYGVLNNSYYTPYLNLKTETYRKFKDFYFRDVLCIYDEGDFDKFTEFVKKHPKFIYKPADDYGGHGVEIYDSSQYDSLEELFQIIIFNGFCVVEELIVQADAIGRLHPQSVNTMRVVAYHSPSGKTSIQWCFLRMGMGGSHTDNMSSGGLAAMVDKETGIIYLPGRDWKGEEHIFHPDTGVQLVGYQIPEWDKLIELVSQLAEVLPELHLVGWDLSYTNKGWVFVEGNARPQCVSAQLTKINGKLHLYGTMLNDYKLYSKGGKK